MPDEAQTGVRRTWPWWRCALFALSALGLVLSSYLSWHYLLGGAVIGCGGGSPCEQVLTSRWSAVAGVLPVTGLAAGAYLAMLVASLFIGPSTPAVDRQWAWGALLLLVAAAAGSGIWFTILQSSVIGAFCPYCMATHATSMLLAALVIWRICQESAPISTESAPTESAPSTNSADSLSAESNAKRGA